MTLADLIAATSAAATAYAAGDDAGTAAALNAKSTAIVSPAQLSVGGVLGVLSTAAQASLWTNPNAATIRNDIRGQDREAVGLWASVARAAGAITADEESAVMAQLAATTSTPASPAEVAFGVGTVVTAAQVTALRPLPVVASITVSLPEDTLAVGASMQATAVCKDAAGNVLAAEVSWGTSNGTVLGVYGDGMVVGNEIGSAQVVAVVFSLSRVVSGSASVSVAKGGA